MSKLGGLHPTIKPIECYLTKGQTKTITDAFAFTNKRNIQSLNCAFFGSKMIS